MIRAHIRLPESDVEPRSPQEALNQPLSSFSATPALSSEVASSPLTQVEAHSSFVQELHAAGMSLHEIGEELGLGRITVRKYVRRPPEPLLPTTRPLRARKLDPYEDNLLKRWSEGERNVSRSTVKSVNKDIQAVQPWCGPTSRTCGALQGMALTLGPARSAHRVSPHAHYVGSSHANLRISKRREQARSDKLLGFSPEVQAVYALLQAFVKMVRERKHEELRSWMEQAIRSGIPELKSFVAWVESD